MIKLKYRRTGLTKLILLVFISANLYSQDPQRFQGEIDDIVKKYDGMTYGNDLIIFTGSSSIRMWKNISDYFPGKNIINTGFGGSQMSDLSYYTEQTVSRYKPSQVFIYEGDNDLAAGKTPGQIIKDTREVIGKIRKASSPSCGIVIIAAKPSPSRWNIKQEYLKLNGMYKELASEYWNLAFADIWDPLLDEKGVPISGIFTSDSLHMNSMGYDIWAEVLRKLIK